MPAEALRPGIELGDLFPGIDGVPSVRVRGITSDSRRAADGYLFIATPGLTTHGMAFADQAIQGGAVAIAYDPEGFTGDAGHLAVPAFAVPGLTDGLGSVANRFFDSPSAAIDVYGITGTNGKTTVAWLLARSFEALGRASGYVGTLGSGLGEIDMEPGMTTPGVIELNSILAEFRDLGARSAAIEVSSHALDQRRVDSIRFRTALFTNLSRDHLDYHGSMSEYFEAKVKLFTECRPDSCVINLDSEWGMELVNRSGGNVVAVSTRYDRVANGRPHVFVRSVDATDTGSDVSFTSSWGDGRFSLAIPGDFNVANATLVLATLLNSDVPLADACEALGEVTAPPGRLERIVGHGNGESPAVYVDYAHTPDALDVVLKALAPHVRGRLFVVFGAGGDRDAGKRPIMAQVAERRADRVVITSDNPRSEDPLAILNDIRAGLGAPDDAMVIEDRAAAIAWAIEEALQGDTVLIAGKGHERYQETSSGRKPFSDVDVAAARLDSLAGDPE